MRILYVGMKYDYGKPEQGYGFEHCNFFDALRRVADEILYFDFMTLLQQHGQRAMNRRLAEVAASEKPDVMFSVILQDKLDFETIQQISRAGITRTVNWFTDDHWQFESHSSHWAPAFNWVVTTAKNAVPKYQHAGYPNVIKSQWACNPFMYRKLDLPLKYDVTFVGQPYGIRQPAVETLRAGGIDVRCWGTGWPEGRLTPEQLIEVFNQSRINLNFSNAAFNTPPRRSTLKNVGRQVRTAAGKVPGVQAAYRHLRQFVRRRRFEPIARSVMLAQSGDQIKGRIFEVPGCGGFLLTGPADNLEDYYKSGEEITTFRTMGDLLDTVRYFLDHEDERAKIAENGYRRTMQEHTYLHRFRDIFRQMGLDATWPEGGRTPAKVTEITV